MYPHAVELAQLAYERCRPGIINIPTNGILPTIPNQVERIAGLSPRTQIIINLSLDGVGEKHDFIRGVPGNFKKLEQCLEQLLWVRTRSMAFDWLDRFQHRLKKEPDYAAKTLPTQSPGWSYVCAVGVPGRSTISSARVP